jgi:hypothetical protein
MEGENKDTLNARCDIGENGFNVLKHLHLKNNKGEVDYEWPGAPYALCRELALAFCQFLRELRFPDGYASNFAKCVISDEIKVQGLRHIIVTLFCKPS